MPVIPSVPYSQIRGELDTGDLFFFYGTSSAAVLIEDLEGAVGWPPYSHAGMVIKDGESLYLWDAPGNGGNCFPDPYAGDPDNRIHGTPVHNGCRVAALDDVLGYYATVVDQPFTLRQLAPAVSQDSFVALRRFINRVDGLPFPLGPGPDKYKEVTGLMANYLAGQEGGSVLYGTYFCAQLVADSYMHMGLLEMEGYPPNGYSPAAFGMDDGLGRLPLVNVALGAATPVEWDRQPGGGQPCPPTRPGSRRRSWQPERAPSGQQHPGNALETTGCITTKTSATVSSRAGPWRHSGETASELAASSVSGSRG